VLERPDIADDTVLASLLAAYNIHGAQVDFLPLGADQSSAVYRITAGDGRAYFLKLRRGRFDEVSLALPKFLGDQGIEQIIAPLPATAGQLQVPMGDFHLALYPFVAGRDGYEVKMSKGQWRDFAAALRRIHTAVLPPALGRQVRRESFSARWRETVKSTLVRARVGPFADALAEEAAVFLTSKLDEILTLVARGEQLAEAFQARAPKFVLCHADIHAGNLHLAGDGDGACYIVDWDEAILAPKERDLMSIGGGLMGGWYSAEEEEALFYAAYGQTAVDPYGLAYYRYERILVDIAEISQQLFAAADSLEDRRQFFGYLTSNFLPGHTIEMAQRADQRAVGSGL
jgi:spectinomycin phosphotransferase